MSQQPRTVPVPQSSSEFGSRSKRPLAGQGDQRCTLNHEKPPSLRDAACADLTQGREAVGPHNSVHSPTVETAMGPMETSAFPSGEQQRTQYEPAWAEWALSKWLRPKWLSLQAEDLSSNPRLPVPATPAVEDGDRQADPKSSLASQVK